MNILILSNKPPYPTKDGSSLATLNMSIGLAEHGNKVKILAFTTQKHPCKIEQIPTEIRALIDFEFVNINTSISRFKAITNILFSRLPFNIERFIDENFSQKLAGILNQYTFDIIQLEGLYLMPYIQDIRKVCKTPIVYRSHNIEHEIWNRIASNETNPIKAWYFKLLSKRIAKMEGEIAQQINALVAISKRDENWFLSRNFSNPSISIPSGYKCYGTSNLTGFTNNDICFLGSLDWIPNQEGLIWFLDNIWPKIKANQPSISLHIAGRNAPTDLAERFKNEIGINYHGEIQNAKDYLNSFSILVVPLLSGSGIRVRIIEGMMLQKAIITTSIGIEGIDAKGGEEAIIVDTPKDFAEATIELINNQSLRARIAEKARNFAMSNYDNTVLTEKLIEFYKQIVQ